MASSEFKLGVVPDLAAIIADPSKVSAIPSETIPAMRGELARLDTLLLGRLLSGCNGQGENGPDGDRLLDVKEAAAKLSVSEGWLYRKHGKLPFTVRGVGIKLLFSEAGIEKWIRQRTGR